MKNKKKNAVEKKISEKKKLKPPQEPEMQLKKSMMDVQPNKLEPMLI
jgi:hypothetical protein